MTNVKSSFSVPRMCYPVIVTARAIPAVPHVFPPTRSAPLLLQSHLQLFQPLKSNVPRSSSIREALWLKCALGPDEPAQKNSRAPPKFADIGQSWGKWRPKAGGVRELGIAAWPEQARAVWILVPGHAGQSSKTDLSTSWLKL